MKHCECGNELVGRERVQCRDCYMKNHPGSSECPFCREWYFTHGGGGTESEKWRHAKKQCR